MNSPVPSLTDLSSDLSSVGSLSPPLPSFDYPSPQSSQDQTSEISGSQQSCLKRFGEPTEIPLRKRRKIEPRPRTTEYLDLQAQYDPLCSNQQAQLDTLLGVLRKKKKIVVIAGAGISVSAGSKCTYFGKIFMIFFLTMSQYLTSGPPVVFLPPSRTSITSKRPENISSMRPFTRLTHRPRHFILWSEDSPSWPAMQNLQPSTTYWPRLESKADSCDSTHRMLTGSIPR